MRQSVRLHVRTTGVFRIIDDAGVERTSNAKKAKGLLALLATAPGKRRSRRWLQDKLWSDRGETQGGASLRQCLTDIRKSFGPYRYCLIADRNDAWLDEAQVSVDLDNIDSRLFADAEAVDFLEGLSVNDDEFETWLRERRSWFDNRRQVAQAEVDGETPTVVAGGGAASPVRPPGVPSLRLQVVRGAHDDTPYRSMIAECIAETVVKTIGELGHSEDDLASGRDAQGRQSAHVARWTQPAEESWLAVVYDMVRASDRSSMQLVLRQPVSERVIYRDVIDVHGSQDISLDDERVLGTINQAVYSAVSELMFLSERFPDAAAASLCCYRGIRHFFRLGRENFEKADALFKQAHDLQPRGIYMAWRAYLRTFMLAERQYDCRETLIEETGALLQRALEVEPGNSFVQAMAAQVYCIVNRSYLPSYHFAQESVRLNRANALGWALLGITRCHLGQAEEGFRNTAWARSIAGTSPYRFHVDAMCCIAATMAGRFEDAIKYGEICHAGAVKFAPPLRYLSALYYHNRDHERSFEMVNKMKLIENDFSYGKLREMSYPSASLRRSPVFECLPAS